MKLQDITQKELMEYLGVAKAVFPKWQYENGKSFLNYIDKIAEYLHVTPQFLFHGRISKDDIEWTAQDISVMKEFHELSTEKREIVAQIISLLKVS